MKISIVFDNYIANEKLESFWGFSCVINDYLIFDTGSNGRALLRNMLKMGINPKGLKYMFISHPHWDHIGGIDSVVDENSQLSLFLPHSLSKFYIRDLKRLSAEVSVISNPAKLFGDFYTTGVMEPIGEQALIIEDEYTLTLISGCAHPGIVNLAHRAIEMLNKPVSYVIGGFHLINHNEKEILKVANDLRDCGVEYVTPTHCSGDLALEIFEEVFGDGFIPGGVGRVIEF
ncbi:MAG: MBL fold metallo-hydrolase [Epsilonproteobacteria bacterium]|nr:MBL fold metallo-hydrolase [Campylobacterota bacterium]